MEKPVSNMLDVTLTRIKEMVDVNMIIGDPITVPDGTTIIPVSELSLGFGAGGSEFSKNTTNNPNGNFGGGAGSGVHIKPVLFLVVNSGNVRVIYVERSGENPFDRVAELAPIVVEKVSSFVENRKAKKAAKQAGSDSSDEFPMPDSLPEVPAE